MKDILSKISPNEALEIVRRLAKSNKELRKRIEKLAEDIIRDVDVEEICDDVFFVLDGIDVHELWDRSGSKSDGYTSPEEMAVEMMEEELDPFNQEVIRFCELNMTKEAKLYCMGVLKGIYRYDHEAESEFKDWAVDMPGECFSYLLDEWRKRCQCDTDLKEMDSFLKKECSEWARWSIAG